MAPTSAGGNFNACTGGCGVAFKLAPDGQGNWTESVLYAFQGADGATPMAPLIFDSACNLYSTTEWGTDNASGTVFKLSPGENGQWSEEVLHSFSFATKDGDEPTAGLVLDGSGNLYGTTQFGGTAGQQGWGTAFRLSPAGGGKWKEAILRSFDRDKGIGGGFVSSGLIPDAKGNLYGTAGAGGRYNNCGAAFRLTPRAKGKWAKPCCILSARGTTDVVPAVISSLTHPDICLGWRTSAASPEVPAGKAGAVWYLKLPHSVCPPVGILAVPDREFPSKMALR